MTVQYCASMCSSNAYFGVEYGGECYCGNTLSAGSMPTFESQCNVPCPGNPAQICGGGNRLSLYGKTNTPPVVTVPEDLPNVDSFVYEGCWTEGVGVRALSGGSIADGAMSTSACGSFCLNLGFVMFGLEYSSECFCGNELAASSTLVGDGDCAMACSGAPGESCGGPNRLSVYRWVSGS